MVACGTDPSSIRKKAGGSVNQTEEVTVQKVRKMSRRRKRGFPVSGRKVGPGFAFLQTSSRIAPSPSPEKGEKEMKSEKASDE
jgi:hypothetical protein